MCVQKQKIITDRY